MLRLPLALVILLLLAPVAGAKQSSILYSADAREAIVTHNGAGYRVSMPAASSITWFTDRPKRLSGTATLSAFAATWPANGFAQDPPNAALVLARRDDVRTHIVELRRPRVSGGRVSFALRALPRATEAGLRHVDTITPGTYSRAELFIDDTAYPPCSARTVGLYATCAMPTGSAINLIAFGDSPWVSFCLVGTGPGVAQIQSPEGESIYRVTAACGTPLQAYSIGRLDTTLNFVAQPSPNHGVVLMMNSTIPS